MSVSMHELPSVLTIVIIPACEPDCGCDHPEAIVNVPFNGPFGESEFGLVPGTYWFPS